MILALKIEYLYTEKSRFNVGDVIIIGHKYKRKYTNNWYYIESYDMQYGVVWVTIVDGMNDKGELDLSHDTTYIFMKDMYKFTRVIWK